MTNGGAVHFRTKKDALLASRTLGKEEEETFKLRMLVQSLLVQSLPGVSVSHSQHAPGAVSTAWLRALRHWRQEHAKKGDCKGAKVEQPATFQKKASSCSTCWRPKPPGKGHPGMRAPCRCQRWPVGPLLSAAPCEPPPPWPRT